MVDLPQLFWTVLKDLADRSRLDAVEAADLLARRLEVCSEKPQILEYEAVGGPAVPFARVTFAVAEAAGRVSLHADVAPGLEVPVMDGLSHWYGTHYGLEVADPEDRERLGMLILKVPVGELQLLFHTDTFADTFKVRHVALYNSVIQRWRGDPPPPPPIARRIPR
ncbi:MAG: hypothetical protein U1E76_20520 [Planctomycetota bacterium]